MEVSQAGSTLDFFDAELDLSPIKSMKFFGKDGGSEEEEIFVYKKNIKIFNELLPSQVFGFIVEVRKSGLDDSALDLLGGNFYSIIQSWLG